MDQFHTPKIPTAEDPIESFISSGQTLVARIIKVDLSAKTMCLSAAPHVLLLKSKQFNCEKGDVLSQGKVLRADRDLGLYMSIPDGNSGDAMEIDTDTKASDGSGSNSDSYHANSCF